jgi:hypothetical protein
MVCLDRRYSVARVCQTLLLSLDCLALLHNGAGHCLALVHRSSTMYAQLGDKLTTLHAIT